MKWISVKEKLPEPNQSVLIFEKGCGLAVSATYEPQNGLFRQWSENCNCHVGDGEGPGFYQQRVTHWMPLPPPPVNPESE